MLAADYTVTTLDDVPIDLSDSVWSLREALQAAATDGENDVDTIEFASNLWGGTMQLTQGQLLIDSNVNVVGPGAELMTIDAHQASRVFKIDIGVEANLSGLKITGGVANSVQNYGGGIVNSGVLTADSIVVTGNSANFHGGGIFVAGDGSLELSNSSVFDNSAGSFGGGLYGAQAIVQISASSVRDNHALRGGGLYVQYGTTIIESSTFEDNEAGYVGGAISFIEGKITISESTLADNRANHAGAIHTVINNNAEVTIVGSTLRGNVASSDMSDGNSGAMEVYGSAAISPGVVTIRDSVFDSNFAQVHGGAIFQLLGTLDISGSTFTNNEASPSLGGYGGALQLSFNSDLMVNITNSTFSGNRAAYGGALNLEGPSSTLDGRTTIVNCTFTENLASYSGSGVGGAIRLNYGSVILENSIVAGNIADDASTSDGSGNLGGTALEPSSHNLIGVGNASLNLDPADHNQIGTQVVPIDPKLAPLDDNGGPTPTHAPLPDSPAIDAGSNANIPAGITKDQRGFSRTVDQAPTGPTGQTVDIGAVELAKVIAPAADFNGDGRDDFATFDTITRSVVVNLGGDGAFRTAVWTTLNPGIWTTFRVGDFNGDGRDDLAFRSISAWSLAISDSTRFVVVPASTTTSWVWDETAVGDFDGDGADELLGWNSSSGKWQMLHFDERTGIRLDADWGAQVHSLIGPGILHVGDANRDGREDLVIRDTAGDWIVSLSQPTNGGTFATQSNWGHWFTPYANTAGTEVDIDAPYQAALDIFSEVRNTFELEFYPGLMKGLEATAETKAGNDWDQAALLVDRLEAAGFEADIASGQVTVPFEAAAQWTGTLTAAAAYSVIHGAMDGNASIVGSSIRFKHAWVRVKVPRAGDFDYVDLDPSWKYKDRQPGIDLSGLTSDQGIFDEFDYLSQSGNQLPIEYFEDQVTQYLDNQGIKASLADVPYDRPILQQQYSVIPTGLGEGMTTFGPVEVFDDLGTILQDSDLKNRLVHQATLSLSRELVSDSRALAISIPGSNGSSLPPSDFDAPGNVPIDLTTSSSLYTINDGGPSDNGTSSVPQAGTRRISGTKHLSVSIPGGYTITPNTRLLVSFNGNATGHNVVFGWDNNSTYDGNSNDALTLAPVSTNTQTLVLSPPSSGYSANRIVLGLRHSSHTSGSALSTDLWVDFTEVKLYEASTGTATIVDGPGGKAIRQQGKHYLSLDAAALEYEVTQHTILEVEFKSDSVGSTHAIGWDVDNDASNDASQASNRFRLSGSSSTYPLLIPVETLPDGYNRFQIPIGEDLGSAESELLNRLIFYTDGSASAESLFRNLKLTTDVGVSSTHWVSPTLAIPEVVLSAISIDYVKVDNASSTLNDDLYRSRLWVGGVLLAQSSPVEVFQFGDNVMLQIAHQAPSDFGIPPTPSTSPSNAYTREPGQILAVSFDANQYSRQHIVDLQAGLNDLLLDGDDVSDIDELLNYTGAKYWYEFNRSNRAVDGLLHTIGTQQWVGSGVVTADPFLLDIPPEAIAHLQFPIVPHDMGVDLPNVTHASYDASTGAISTEAFQLTGYNASALENAILEDVINSESISTIRGLQRAYEDIRGLRFNDTTISREAIQVFESVPNELGRNIFFRGEIGDNAATPFIADRTNMSRTRQQLLDYETGGLKNHVKEANSIADILENVSGQAVGTVRVLVPRSRSQLGEWTGTVYVAEYETTTGRHGAYIISPDGGTPTEGGYSGNVVAPKNLQLPEASFLNQSYAGDPVNVANGNMFRDEVDFRFANRDIPLDFARHYDSQNNMDVGFGVGWTHSFTGVLYRDLDSADDNKIVWLRADGQRHTFERPDANSPYEVPASLNGTFETVVDGGVTFYIYRENDGTQYWFESVSFDDSGVGSHVVGRLVYLAARNDDGVQISYSGVSSLRVSKVEDYLTYERRLDFQYTPASAFVTRTLDSQPISTWRYNFDNNVSGGPGNTTRRLVSAVSDTDSFVTASATTYYEYYDDGFDARIGLIWKIIEPNLESHEFEYYANGRVFRVTDGEGHQQTFSYNLFRNLTEFTDERGNVETYIHQDNGLLQRQIHADRSRMTFTWGAPDTHEEFLMTSSTDEVGAKETFTYYQPTDPNYRPGELKQSVSKDGIVTNYEYWVSSDPNYHHVSELSKITVVNPGGPDLITQYTDRDDRGMLMRMEDAEGNVTEREYYGYDTQTTPQHLLGRLKSETQPKGVEGDEAVTWQPLVDEFTVTGGTLSVRLLAPGTEVGNKRVIADAIRIDRVDDDAVFTRVIDDDQSGTNPFFRIVATGGVGSSTTLTQPKYEGDATSILGTSSEDRSATWIFTDLLPGTYRVSAVWTWNSDRDAAAHYELFDGIADGGIGDATADVDQTVPPAGFHSYQTVFDYDTAGNVISAVTEALPAGTQTYDSFGNVTYAVDATGVATTNVYDILGRLVSTSVSNAADPSLPAVSTTTYQYDASGRLLSTTDALGRTTVNTYDLKGNLTKQVYADGTSVEYKYDGFGNVTESTDERGRTTRFIYDSRNRPVLTIFPDGTSTRQRYDGAGQIKTSFDELGRATNYRYDSAGRLLVTDQEVQFNGALEDVAVAINTYDDLGRLTERTDANGNTTIYEYDQLGRVVEMRVLDNGNPALPPVYLSTTAYDANGNLAEEVVYDVPGLVRPVSQGGAGLSSIPDDPTPLIGTYPDFVQRVTTQYDAFGRIVAVRRSEGLSLGVAPFGEVGQIEIHQVSGSSWTTVNLQRTYTNPVVIASLTTQNDDAPTTLRVRNAGSSSFEVQIDEWDYLLYGSHGTETLVYLVVEAGEHELAGGYKLLAGTADVDHNLHWVSFGSSFDNTPVVLAQAMTYNSWEAVATRLQVAANFGFNVRVQEEEAADGLHTIETVGYVAIDKVSGHTDGAGDLQAGFSGQYVNDATANVALFPQFDEAPLLLAAMQTFADSDPSVAQVTSVASHVFTVYVDEEESSDSETDHAAENIGYVAFEQAGLLYEESLVGLFTQTSYIYDAAGRGRYGVDELGRRTEQQYDAYGRLERTIAPDPDGSGPQESAATRFERDALGNVTHEWQYFGTYDGVANVEHDNRYVYDGRNRLVTTFMKDDEHRTDVQYDAAGRQIATTDALGNTTYSKLDERGRVLQQRLADPDGTGYQVAPVTTYSYDAVGNVTSTTDPVGNTTWFAYDSLNRLREEKFTVLYDIVDNTDPSPAFMPYGGLTGTLQSNQVAYGGSQTNVSQSQQTGTATGRWLFPDMPAGLYQFSATWPDASGPVVMGRGSLRVGGSESFVEPALIMSRAPNEAVREFSFQWNGWENLGGPWVVNDSDTIETFLYAFTDVLHADAVRADRVASRSYEYDNNGNLLSETDTLGNTTNYAYDELNRQTSVKLPDPDGAGPLGRPEMKSSYDGYGNLIKRVETRGTTPSSDDRTDTFEYDQRNRLVKETLDAGGTGHLNITTTYEYDAVGNQTLVTDSLGYQTHSRYDDANRLIDEYQDFGEGRGAAFQFDPGDISDPYPTYYTGSHQLSADGSEVTLEGNSYVLADIGNYTVTHRTVLEFDLQADNFPELALIGYSNAQQTVTRYFELTGSNSYPEYYSTEFRQERLPDGTVRFHIPVGEYLSDAEKASGLDISQLEFYNEHIISDLGDNGLPTSTFSNIHLYESDEVRTVYTYDTRGNLETVRTASDPRNITTSYRYDLVGKQTHQILDDGGPLDRVYKTTYDAVGNVLVDRNHTAGTETTYEYDNLYRLTKTTLPDSDGDSATPNNLVTMFWYDTAGRRLGETNGEGETTATTYNELGLPVIEWDGNGDTTQYRYDTEGNLLSVTDAEGNVTTYEYDALNRMTTDTDVLGHSRTYVYDNQGNVKSITDRNGRVRDFTYDALDRQVTEEWKNSVGGSVVHTLEWQYDDLGRTTRQDDGGLVDTFAYDGLGRMVEQTNYAPEDPLSTEQVEIKQTYDYGFLITPGFFGGPITMQDRVTRKQFLRAAQGELAFGRTFYDYDRLGQLVYAADNGLSSAAPIGLGGKAATFGYDASGNLKEIDRADSESDYLKTLYTYDQANRLTDIVHTRPVPWGDIAHTYMFDNASRITSFDTLVDGNSTADRGYTYDNDGQLTDATGPVVEDYDYDANGNRTGANGQTIVTDAANRVVDDGTYFYQYDAEGNLTWRTLQADVSQSTRYTWDHRNRLVQISEVDPTGTTVDFDQYSTGLSYYSIGSVNQLGANGVPGSFAVLDDGLTLELSGNSWRSMWRPTVTVTEDTYIEFDYYSEGTAEWQGFGLDTTRTTSSGEYYFYQLGGLDEPDIAGTTKITPAYPLADGGFHYRVRLMDHPELGDGYAFTRLILVNDDDGAGSGNSVSRFSNVVIYQAAPSDELLSYTYDAADRRVVRTLDPDGPGTEASTNQYFVYDGSRLQMTFGNDREITHHYLQAPAIDQVLADEIFYFEGEDSSYQSDDVLWQLADHQGTIRDVANSSGTPRRHVDYDSFGFILNISWFGQNGQPIGPLNPEAIDQLFYYTGQERDETTGLQLHGARWYDPATARWLSEDPSGFDGGDPNLYRYVGNSAPNAVDPTGFSLQKPFANLPSISSMGTTRGLDPYGINTPIASGLASKPFSTINTSFNATTFVNFVGPTRPTAAPLGDSSFINASNIGQYVDNSRKVVSVEVLDGIHAGDTVRNTYNSLAAGFQNTADHTDSALSAFANQYAASAIRTFGRIEGAITDVVLPPSEPDARIHYSDGRTLTVLGGGPTSGALLGQGLALLPVVLPRGPAIASQEVTAGPVARTAPGKTFIPETHVRAAAGEYDLIQTAQRQGEVVLKVNRTVTDTGADLVTYNPRTGQVTLWDNKATIGRLNSAGQRVPKTVGPSATLNKPDRLSNVLTDAEQAVRASNLPPEEQASAIQFLRTGNFRKVTRGSGNAKNSVIQYGAAHE